MNKKIAIMVPDPVNGLGLFAYLESFLEAGVDVRTFAVSVKPQVKTNSGYTINLNGLIADLKGNEAQYDGLVFACGDAIKDFSALSQTPPFVDMFQVIQAFSALNKPIAGHCAGGLIFDMLKVANNKRISMCNYQPARDGIKHAHLMEEPNSVDGNLFTAQDEHYIICLIPAFIKSL